MNELQTERRLRDWLDAQALPAVPDDLRQSVAAIPATVAPSLSDRIATILGWRQAAAVPAFAWVLLLAGLLLAVVVGGLVAGGLRLDRLVTVPPGPMPAMTVVDEASDILATTKARQLPAQATCPAGSDPDALGPADQWRPAGTAEPFHPGGAMAFDRHAGRVVLVTEDGRDPYGRAATWTYDVCANAWHQMSPVEEPRATLSFGNSGPVRLVYDADSDRTVAFVQLGRSDGPDVYEIWSYDLATDRWTKAGALPGTPDAPQSVTHGTTFYHDPSGLVVTYDGATMWAYDVETNTLARVRQQPDPALPAGSGMPQGKIAFGYDPRHDQVAAVVFPFVGAEASDETPPLEAPAETWTFDPGTGSWLLEATPAAADLIVCGGWADRHFCFGSNGRSVFDEALGVTVFINRDSAGANPGRVDAYDAGQRTWRTLHTPGETGAATVNWCASMPPVYDPLNGRIVCLSSSPDHGAPGVSAFSSATGQWRWLLEPSETPPLEPTLAPGATPIDWGTPPPDWEPGPQAEPSVNPAVP